MNFLDLSQRRFDAVDRPPGVEYPGLRPPARQLAAYRKSRGRAGAAAGGAAPGAARRRIVAIRRCLAIDVVQHLGHETLLDTSRGPHRLIARVPPDDDSQIGETRAFLVDLEKMHLFDPDSGVNLAPKA